MVESSVERAQGAGVQPGRSLLATALIGAGVMAAVDEIVFHQLLHWHHFYDRGTSDGALVSDGFLHAVELVIIVGGFFLLADLLRQRAFAKRHGWAGLLIGLGGFQLFDGVVDHKVLDVHQIRYDVELLPYDVAWIGGALVVLALGLLLLARARRSPEAHGERVAPGERAGA